ncbi:hypothetical protein MIND_00375300 [Mycena indigotica]|uniref:Uncharacterized protein n=1 Tax=Mycena indigotica TaxID=2126181 RepID=A0A8H6T346_9AGAR|nr:uncharacterized protein MIND_00375300 [Mycena indigotica]KAF7310024.1 hypothetical protein MIND_00375300 [Mycena indigotica]
MQSRASWYVYLWAIRAVRPRPSSSLFLLPRSLPVPVSRLPPNARCNLSTFHGVHYSVQTGMSMPMRRGAPGPAVLGAHQQTPTPENSTTTYTLPPEASTDEWKAIYNTWKEDGLPGQSFPVAPQSTPQTVEIEYTKDPGGHIHYIAVMTLPGPAPPTISTTVPPTGVSASSPTGDAAQNTGNSTDILMESSTKSRSRMSETSRTSLTDVMLSTSTFGADPSPLGATDVVPTTSIAPTSASAASSASSPTHSARPGTPTHAVAIGVGTCIAALLLAAAAFLIYRKCKRRRDRRAWERTHAEIADAVRQVGGAGAAVGGGVAAAGAGGAAGRRVSALSGIWRRIGGGGGTGWRPGVKEKSGEEPWMVQEKLEQATEEGHGLAASDFSHDLGAGTRYLSAAGYHHERSRSRDSVSSSEVSSQSSLVGPG